ncbi:ABC transporter permease subunit [Arthrobacter zhaoxinii]|uniref:ABC transporter permease subunit n=1 Tax=Arthrobacter zhaoxinii TaxID=2964616 RepID=A0ABY5YPS0_9MICC|nr:ABC transporter permease subunit [Arthrobacter zhaoxinii]UWX97074.1 ABC transporter permease subunit [Arthrobacter zhaoxinii]
MTRVPPWAVGVTGAAAVLALWWVGAATFLSGIGAAGDGGPGAIPTPWQVLAQMGADGWGFYWRNAAVTLAEAGAGYLWGNALALLLAFLVLLVPRLEQVATQLAVVSYCLPVVAVGPVIFIVLGPPRSGESSGTAVALAALSVFFTTMVSALAGLKAADRACLDIVTVFGGRRIHQLLKVRIIAALPSVLAALKIAAPAALLGAILGEYVGGVDRGLGPAMVNAQQTLEVARVWGVAGACAALAGSAYAVLGLLSRVVVPWSSGGPGVRMGGL